MNKYKLYGGYYTRSRLTEMVFIEGGIDYDFEDINIVNKEHLSPEYLEISPTGKVPTMITPEGTVVYETPGINLYLCERHQLTHLVPSPNDPDRARFLSGYFYVAGELEPALKRFFYPYRYVRDPSDIEWMRQKSLQDSIDCFSVINTLLQAETPYFLGDRYSLIDMCITYWATHIDSDELLEEFPALLQCISLVKKRPCLQQRLIALHNMHIEYKTLNIKH